MSTPSRLAFLFVISLFAASDAGAFCLPKFYYRCVGDTNPASATYDIYATDPDIQTAINNTVCNNTVISISQEKPAVLTNATIEIYNKPSLTLVGLDSGANCNSAPKTCDPDVGCGGSGTPPNPTLILHGTGAGSVLYIHGSNSVTLEYLQLRDGGGTDFGGGIHFTGTGSLTIIDSVIDYNTANSAGGGIQFNGSGGSATLTLGAGTLVDENVSNGDGGGIHINGSARLFALKPYTFIGYNQATNHGGGVYVAGPAQADIGSPGYGGSPVIVYNYAQYGGGIAMDAAPDDNNVTVRLFSTDPHAPVSVSNNRATNTGGGIWMHPYISGISNTYVYPVLCAFDFRLDNNVAQEGTAIYSDTDYSAGNGHVSGNVYFNSNPQSVCNAPEGTVSSLGAVQCAPGVTCNTLNTNVAEDNSNDPKPGAVILLQDGGVASGGMIADRFSMRGNTGGHAIRAFDVGVDISNCLIADNGDALEVIRIESDGGGGSTSIGNCTVVNNTVGSGDVIHSPYPLTLTDSIIDEPGINTLDYSGAAANLAVSDVLATDISTLPSAAGIDQGEPLYVDAAKFDYHLQPTSTGIDFAPASGGQDLDGNPRDVNLSGVSNPTPRDIGAYERQNRFQCGTSDSIYCNGYEYSW